MSGQHVSCERALVVDLSHASRVFLRVVWFSSLSKINTQVNIDSEKSLNGNDQLHAKKNYYIFTCKNLYSVNSQQLDKRSEFVRSSSFNFTRITKTLKQN